MLSSGANTVGDPDGQGHEESNTLLCRLEFRYELNAGEMIVVEIEDDKLLRPRLAALEQIDSRTAGEDKDVNPTKAWNREKP